MGDVLWERLCHDVGCLCACVLDGGEEVLIHRHSSEGGNRLIEILRGTHTYLHAHTRLQKYTPMRRVLSNRA